MADDMTIQAAAMVSVSVANAAQLADVKVFKDMKANELAVATMAMNMPVNPALGRNVNTVA